MVFASLFDQVPFVARIVLLTSGVMMTISIGVISVRGWHAADYANEWWQEPRWLILQLFVVHISLGCGGYLMNKRAQSLRSMGTSFFARLQLFVLLIPIQAWGVWNASIALSTDKTITRLALFCSLVGIAASLSYLVNVVGHHDLGLSLLFVMIATPLLSRMLLSVESPWNPIMDVPLWSGYRAAAAVGALMAVSLRIAAYLAVLDTQVRFVRRLMRPATRPRLVLSIIVALKLLLYWLSLNWHYLGSHTDVSATVRAALHGSLSLSIAVGVAIGTVMWICWVAGENTQQTAFRVSVGRSRFLGLPEIVFAILLPFVLLVGAHRAISEFGQTPDGMRLFGIGVFTYLLFLAAPITALKMRWGRVIAATGVVAVSAALAALWPVQAHRYWLDIRTAGDPIWRLLDGNWPYAAVSLALACGLIVRFGIFEMGRRRSSPSDYLIMRANRAAVLKPALLWGLWFGLIGILALVSRSGTTDPEFVQTLPTTASLDFVLTLIAAAVLMLAGRRLTSNAARSMGVILAVLPVVSYVPSSIAGILANAPMILLGLLVPVVYSLTVAIRETAADPESLHRLYGEVGLTVLTVPILALTTLVDRPFIALEQVVAEAFPYPVPMLSSHLYELLAFPVVISLGVALRSGAIYPELPGLLHDYAQKVLSAEEEWPDAYLLEQTNSSTNGALVFALCSAERSLRMCGKEALQETPAGLDLEELRGRLDRLWDHVAGRTSLGIDEVTDLLGRHAAESNCQYERYTADGGETGRNWTLLLAIWWALHLLQTEDADERVSSTKNLAESERSDIVRHAGAVGDRTDAHGDELEESLLQSLLVCRSLGIYWGEYGPEPHAGQLEQLRRENSTWQLEPGLETWLSVASLRRHRQLAEMVRAEEGRYERTKG